MAFFMRRMIFSSVARPALPNFSTYVIKGRIFRKKELLQHEIPVLIFSTSSFRDISHSEKNSVRYDHKFTQVFFFFFFFFFSLGPRAYAPDAPQPVGLLCYSSVLDVPTFAASPSPRPCYPRDP
jgi:hypothetical protein